MASEKKIKRVDFLVQAYNGLYNDAVMHIFVKRSVNVSGFV